MTTVGSIINLTYMFVYCLFSEIYSFMLSLVCSNVDV